MIFLRHGSDDPGPAGRLNVAVPDHRPRRRRYSIVAINSGSIHDPIRGGIDRLAESKSLTH